MDAKTVKGLVRNALNGVRQAFSGTTTTSAHNTDNPTYTVNGLAGESLPDVEMFQQFGFSSRLPAGTQVIVLPLGGSTSHAVVIASEHDGVRVKNLAEGEAVMFSDEGAFVHIKKGKIIEVEGDTFNFKCKNFNVSADNFNMKAANAIAMQSNTFGVTAAGGSKIEGDLIATGGITDSKGSMQGMRDTFNSHTNNNQGLSSQNM